MKNTIKEETFDDLTSELRLMLIEKMKPLVNKPENDGILGSFPKSLDLYELFDEEFFKELIGFSVIFTRQEEKDLQNVTMAIISAQLLAVAQYEKVRTK